uniref:RecF/RecN/SMC N-terminal domain-containing protein n=1 Tax=Ditylenchus dipsaci TaxID=166011 RepID=A0A915E1F9_9BILA
MFIKEINITGFRSYRDTTSVNNFSPKHNVVVVGRNGSGKSNFFYAIQFVLSNEYSHLNQEQRHNILHEVPILSEVRIMRQVGQKKDQYFIDNKVVTRTDVAGTRVFDEKKEESLKILQEPKEKLRRVSTLLSFIDGRLNKLEEEKEDLKDTKMGQDEKGGRIQVYELEVKEARNKCDKLPLSVSAEKNLEGIKKDIEKKETGFNYFAKVLEIGGRGESAGIGHTNS